MESTDTLGAAGKNSPRWPAYMLLAGFSVLVHLYGLRSPLLDYHAYRQCQTAAMARNFTRFGMHFFDPMESDYGAPVRDATEFPLYSYGLAWLFKWFGAQDVIGRLWSMFFAAWGAIILYRIAERRVGEKAARWAGLTVSVLPVHLYFTRAVQPEPMALCGLLGFVFYAERWAREDRTPDALLAALFGATATLLKLPYVPLLCLLWLYLGVERWPSSLVRQGRWGLLLAAILGATGLWYAYARTAPVEVLPLNPAQILAYWRPVFTAHLWAAHFISRLPELCLTYSGIVFAAAGAHTLWKNRTRSVEAQKTFRFGVAWFAATAVYIVFCGDYGLVHRYTELPFAPVCALFIGVGITTLLAQARTGLARAALVVLIVGIPVHAAFRIGHWYRVEDRWLLRAGPVVAGLSRPEDLFLTNTPENPVYLYYINRFGYSVDLEERPFGWVEWARRRGARFFLTSTDGAWGHHPEWAGRLSRVAHLVHEDPQFLIYAFEKPGQTLLYSGTRKTS